MNPRSPHVAVPPPLRGLLRTGLALAVLGAAGGCGDQARHGDADLQVRWRFEPSPPRVGRVEIRLDVSDVDWTPRNGARVVVTGLRDGIAMAVDTAVGRGAGSYVAGDFTFVVSGAWTLKARVEIPDGRWVEVEQALTVEAPGP